MIQFNDEPFLQKKVGSFEPTLYFPYIKAYFFFLSFFNSFLKIFETVSLPSLEYKSSSFNSPLYIISMRIMYALFVIFLVTFGIIKQATQTRQCFQ